MPLISRFAVQAQAMRRAAAPPADRAVVEAGFDADGAEPRDHLSRTQPAHATKADTAFQAHPLINRLNIA
jgi:hypothetical protein